MAKLRGDPAKNAFKKALGTAVQQYTTGERLALADWLLREDGLLADPIVTAELAQIIKFDREPDPNLLGERWKLNFADLLPGRDYAKEANLFLSYFKEALLETEVFRPVFEAKSISAIAATAATSNQLLSTVEKRLSVLTELIDSKFGVLTRAFAVASPGIRGQILDFTGFIEDRTQGFVGRHSVFQAIDEFIGADPSGYMFVSGDPGIGKSAIAAELVKNKGYIHHFNIRAQGINSAAAFLRNVCAQLIAVHGLEYDSLPPETTEDSAILTSLLKRAASRAHTNQKIVILVDGLDEVDRSGVTPGVNQLFLPITVPSGVYILVTLRKNTTKPRIESKMRELLIDHNSASNIADIKAYIHRSARRTAMQAYIADHGITDQVFVDQMAEKSQGNFMYLRYVLPEIEDGAYKDLAVKSLPSGLKNYYEDHWQRMRSCDEESWFKYKLPIIMALTAVKSPVSIDLISEFARVKEIPRIRGVLQEWGQFLHEELVEYQGVFQKRYRIYHESFHEFIADKQEVQDERVNLAEAHGKIADNLWHELFGDERFD
jgi:AAA ATPase domain